MASELSAPPCISTVEPPIKNSQKKWYSSLVLPYANNGQRTKGQFQWSVTISISRRVGHFHRSSGQMVEGVNVSAHQMWRHLLLVCSHQKCQKVLEFPIPFRATTQMSLKNITHTWHTADPWSQVKQLPTASNFFMPSGRQLAYPDFIQVSVCISCHVR